MRKINNRIFNGLISIFIILIDFIIKRLVILKVKGTAGFTLVKNLVDIIYVENKGAAFGMFSGRRFLIISIPIIFIILLLVMIFKENIKDKVFLFFASLVIGGGIGNLIDRIIYGYVIDYIKLSFFAPVCNFADYCITLGVSGLIFYIVFLHKDIKDDSERGKQ